MSILDITTSFGYDNSIESYEYHSYKPYVTSYNLNDEIRIPINQQDMYVLPSASTLYIEGTIAVVNRDTKASVSSVLLTNNPILHLFQDIRYELNGIEIDKIKNVGVTTTMKSLLSMNEHEAKIAKSWGWDIHGTKITHGSFSASIPLNKILGFAEDYNKIVINCKHELILLRSNTNLNCVKLNTNEYVDNITLSKVVWRMPHIKVSDQERLNLLKFVEKDRPIQVAFRNWDLYEYPLLPKTSKHSWAIKTSSQIEKPRYVIVGLKTGRKNTSEKDVTRFDNCNLREVKLYLNSTYFPYENLNVSFSDGRYAILYEQYAKFQQSYYNRCQAPLLSPQDFKDIAPLFFLDCSRQSDTLKSGVVDVRIELECDTDIPDQTSAYCLILNDSIIEYRPLSNITKKIS
jgi:hypothetical protein